MNRIRCIAWDFDGVLNRNVVDGQFIWQDGLGKFGIDRLVFEAFMFADGFWPIMRGEEDLLYRLQRFRDHVGFETEAIALLEYWFNADAYPCSQMISLMERVDAAGIRQVIATNNEHRRSSFIENEMGYSKRVEKLFSSGRMGVAKPDPAYFRAIENDLELEPHQILFVDDFKQNIDAAKACGWQVHHFPENGQNELIERLAEII